MTRQINSRGQALEDGLDVFISVPFLSRMNIHHLMVLRSYLQH